MEKLSLKSESFPAICAAILPVAADRMADGRHVRPDLMGATRLEPNANEGGSGKALEHPEMCYRGSPAVGSGRYDGAPDAIAA